MSENIKNKNANNEDIEVVSMSVEECEIALGELEEELAAFVPEETDNTLPKLSEYLAERTNDADDPLLSDAAELAVRAGKVSTSILQRKLSVGYGRSAKMLDRLEELGIIAPPDGTKPRKVLMRFSDVVEDEPELETSAMYDEEEDAVFKDLDAEKATDSDGAVFAFKVADTPKSSTSNDSETDSGRSSSVTYIDEDELFKAAARLVVSEGVVSTSFLQRRLSIGYGRACAIIDRLEELAIIAPADGNRARGILVSPERLERILATV